MGRGENLLYDPPRIRRTREGSRFFRQFSFSEKAKNLSWDGERIVLLSQNHLHLVTDDQETSRERLSGQAIGFNAGGVVLINKKSKMPSWSTFSPEGDLTHSILGNQGLKHPLLRAFPVIKRDGNLTVYALDLEQNFYRGDFQLATPDPDPRWETIASGLTLPQEIFSTKDLLLLAYEDPENLESINAICLYRDDSHRDLKDVNREIYQARGMVSLDGEPLFYLKKEIISAQGDRIYQSKKEIIDISSQGSLVAILEEGSVKILHLSDIVYEEKLRDDYRQIELGKGEILLLREDGLGARTLSF